MVKWKQMRSVNLYLLNLKFKMFFAFLVVLAVGNVTVYSSPPEKNEYYKIIEAKPAYSNKFFYHPSLEQIGILRIIRGRLASIGQFPYQVSLQVGINTHICGGSIIGSHWILTSASCVYKERRKIHAVVGTNNIKTGGVRYRIAKVIIHPKFKSGMKLNNIALLQSSLKIVFNSIVRNVNLAYSMVEHDCVNMTLSGWSSNSSLSNYLQYATVTNIPLPTCTLLLPNSVNSTRICTHAVIGQKGTCGDMGDPLVYNNTQYGILDWIFPRVLGKPDVYTNVATFRFWIYSNTGI